MSVEVQHPSHGCLLRRQWWAKTRTGCQNPNPGDSGFTKYKLQYCNSTRTSLERIRTFISLDPYQNTSLLASWHRTLEHLPSHGIQVDVPQDLPNKFG